MKSKRIALILCLIVAFLLLAITGCGASGPVLSGVKVTPEEISPNGDGTTDVATIVYHIGRSSSLLTITLVDEKGTSYTFRDREPRSAGNYQARFSGVIETPVHLSPFYTTTQATVLPDGVYRVVVEAESAGKRESAETKLTIKNGDNTPPGFGDFSVFTPLFDEELQAARGAQIVFTPNRDGIGDRIAVSYWLTKQATVEVYLLNIADTHHTKYPIAEVSKLKPGRYNHDYEGGVDLGNTPPPNGEYVVVGEATDSIGNHAVITRALTIADGGVPLAHVIRSKITPQIVSLDGLVRIEVTVENVGTVAIRSQGPYSGTVYTTEQNYNTLGFPEISGVFRVEADFEGNSAGRSYPFRWGFQNDVLLPGERQTVVGYIKMTEQPTKSPIYFWVGLQHESVRVVDDKVNPTLISIGY